MDRRALEVEVSSGSVQQLGELERIHGRAQRKALLLAQKIAHIKRGCVSICQQLGLPILC